MALSYYNNWPENYSGGISAYPPSPVPEMFCFHEESAIYDTGINPIFDQRYGDYSDNNIIAPAGVAGNEFVPSREFQVSSFMFQDPYYSYPQLFPVEYAMPPQLPPELPPLAETGGCCYGGDGGCATLPPWGGEVEVKWQNDDGGGSGGGLSAQSMAARVRRRKISEKTQELGKLIPGGHKMNTAEMFQAAFKYIKFLQAQIGVLKLMPSIQESEEVLSSGEMQALVTCTLMQEKLYTAEKCIGPNALKKSS